SPRSATVRSYRSVTNTTMSAGNATGARISSSSASRLGTVLRRGRRTGLLIGVVFLAGCATRADLLQVKQDQREVRALLADQQVAVEGLRRRIEMLRGELG